MSDPSESTAKKLDRAGDQLMRAGCQMTQVSVSLIIIAVVLLCLWSYFASH